MWRLWRRLLPPPRNCGSLKPMLDLGTTFLAGVARDPDALAIVDGPLRLTYAQWYQRISAVIAALDALGLALGDRLVTVLTGTWAGAPLIMTCQLAGLTITASA